MVKFGKGYIIGFCGIIGMLFLIDMVCADITSDCTLRVPIGTGYNELEDAMLLNLSVPELIERIYPDYERYIILLEKLYNNLEKNQGINNVDMQEYTQLKKKLGNILNLWNTKVIALWENSKEWGCALKNAEGSKLFAEWKEKAILYKWLEEDSDIQMKLDRLFASKLNFGRYTPINHFDVFVKAKDGNAFIYTQHIHSDLFMIDLFSLIPLGGVVHIFPGQYGTDPSMREGVYQFYTENYEDRVMQIDSNGLFSLPAVDTRIAQLMDVENQLPSPDLRRAL